MGGAELPLPLGEHGDLMVSVVITNLFLNCIE
jgi:hypothetical protein